MVTLGPLERELTLLTFFLLFFLSLLSCELLLVDGAMLYAVTLISGIVCLLLMLPDDDVYLVVCQCIFIVLDAVCFSPLLLWIRYVLLLVFYGLGKSMNTPFTSYLLQLLYYFAGPFLSNIISSSSSCVCR